MTRESLCADLIERYLSTCDVRFLQDERGGAYFFVPSADHQRLRVHLEISPSFGDVLTVQVTPANAFPVADRRRLTHMADAWNRRNRDVTAVVQGCSDPQRIAVVARRSQWIREGISFDRFGSFVDRTLAAAIDLFAELAPVVEVPSTTHPLLRDAG
ncbi:MULTISPECIES: YbjN domain-containing protein [unclassified Mycobacterium]|uniref:YbjN domain-containing protein n=1 Tax=unclassified Mycobacterium TaxID=2642494 RepID=UPI0007FDA10B|nr:MULTISPECIES: YbjN domain-containing protein [unclassified Mycobacterium]OBH02032.1 hypothetical protein A5696_12450 [Mycobacterium sp. E2699]OBI49175.1 hypothetical protein A5705_13920 [Mycobacterium sp. E787]